MFRRYLLPLLSLAGLCFAAYTVLYYARPQPVAQPVAQPPKPAMERKVAGTGLVEAATRNIEIASHVSEVVDKVLAKAGDTVQAGQPLFVLDTRGAQAQVAVARAALAEAEARHKRLQAAPRAEEVPPAKARVAAAEAEAAQARTRLEVVDKVQDTRAVSDEDRRTRRLAVAGAEARLAEARAALALLLAGAWDKELAEARAQVESARARLESARTTLDLHTARAPVAGQVLQVNLRPGEFAQAGRLAQPLVLMGAVSRLHVRVDIDENDAWRFDPKAKAVAYVRGNAALSAPLAFEYLEPYVVPKRSLTGAAVERVDTRVLQAVYSFDPQALKVYAGQILDVFVDDTGS